MRIVGNQKIDMEEPLWRYFKTARFVELMQTGYLHFASARQFNDRFEGAVAVLPPGFSIDPRYSELEMPERAFEQLRRLTKISCWHRASYESDAMWHLYAGSHKGVAIRTNAERIKAAASPFRVKPTAEPEGLWAGNVNYVDLLKERLRVSMIERFWYKHMAFAWESEFRLGISVRLAEEFGVQVPELGISVAFDLATLIDRIYLGPLLPKSEADAVHAAAEKSGLKERVRTSSLLGTPRYT